MDALQLFIRGFENRQRGNVIQQYLTEIGFEINEAFDGGSDSLGGLIETNIVHQDSVEESDPAAILDELRSRTGFEGVWLQTREFRLVQECEYGREVDDQDDEGEPPRFRVIASEQEVGQ